jgi:hypothetical protein
VCVLKVETKSRLLGLSLVFHSGCIPLLSAVSPFHFLGPAALPYWGLWGCLWSPVVCILNNALGIVFAGRTEDTSHIQLRFDCFIRVAILLVYNVVSGLYYVTLVGLDIDGVRF